MAVDDVDVNLAGIAAQVLDLARRGDADAAGVLAQAALDGAAVDTTEPSDDLAALWLAVGVRGNLVGESDSLVLAADRCLAIAAALPSPGWASNALSLRAVARVRQGSIDLALTDLARSEVELAECADPLLRGWGHTSLGCCYDQLRLYELAQPHLEAALAMESSPLPPTEPFVMSLRNLAELHLRWAEELERVTPFTAGAAEVQEHREQARRWAREALLARYPGQLPLSVLASQSLDLRARADTEPDAVLSELIVALEAAEQTRSPSERAEVATAIARALQALGRRNEAIAAAKQAVEVAAGSIDWQVTAGAHYLLVELEAEAGVPGAAEGRAYGRLLSDVLWQQHLQTLQGARSALDVERLERTTETATQAAREDPLTGLGNRRALDEAIGRLAQTADAERQHHSLVLFDLDAFKAINDSHGHLVGDEVLKAVARTLRACARRADLLVRLGGDEFVVLAAGATKCEVAALAARIHHAIDGTNWAGIAPGLQVGISIGFAATGDGMHVTDLIGAADAAMYADKRRHHVGVLALPSA